MSSSILLYLFMFHSLSLLIILTVPQLSSCSYLYHQALGVPLYAETVSVVGPTHGAVNVFVEMAVAEFLDIKPPLRLYPPVHDFGLRALHGEEDAAAIDHAHLVELVTINLLKDEANMSAFKLRKYLSQQRVLQYAQELLTYMVIYTMLAKHTANKFILLPHENPAPVILTPTPDQQKDIAWISAAKRREEKYKLHMANNV
ncbi:MAG: hypothetical protein FRX48_01741 [Lasallia pustulata]|uniref:Uncharacterized protein n=1 Tax=Lasallia pustulata TaxID=136370 RepID=A0A5M8Q193_9LECA|nr:MAG: hypothetical protein FRX48_01741 [Lasallia pustulata]